MARLADETGGEYFYHNNDMVRGMREAMAPEVKYVLGFDRPDVHDGRYHPLKVKVSGGHGYEVQARPGYQAPTPEEVRSGVSSGIDQAVLKADRLNAIDCRFALRNHSLNPDVPSLNVTAHMDVSSLVFRENKGRQNQKLTFVAVLFDDKGSFVVGNEAMLDLSLRPPTLKHVKTSGINCTLQLIAPRGIYQLRIVIREEGGDMTTAYHPSRFYRMSAEPRLCLLSGSRLKGRGRSRYRGRHSENECLPASCGV